MKVIDDFNMASWLVSLVLPIQNFEWDHGNISKNLKHGVSKDEIEELLNNDFFFAGQIMEPEHDEKRWLLLGTDQKSKKLALIFTIRDGKIRPISCRPMRGEEKILYEEKKEGSGPRRI